MLEPLGGPVDIIRDWARLQGASAQQERLILAASDSNYLASSSKPRKWRDISAIPRNKAFRSRYYQQVARILGWKERHVRGFSNVVRDTLRNVVWPDHGEEQGDMATDYPQGIGENGAYTLMLQWSELQWPKEVNVRRKVLKLAVKRGASIRTTTTQTTCTK